MSLSLRVSSKDVITRSGEGGEDQTSYSDADSDIDPSDFHLLVFSSTGDLIDCFTDGNLSDGNYSVVLDAEGLISVDCKLEVSKYLGKGDIRFVVIANGKGLGNTGFDLRGISRYEDLRKVTFNVQTRDVDNATGSSPVYIPMYGETTLAASRLSRYNINLEIGIKRCVAKIEIIDALESAEIISATMTKGMAKGYYIISDTDGVAGDKGVDNAGESDNSATETIAINFYSKESAEGKKVFYAYLPEMSLPSDAKAEERKIELKIKGTDGVEASYNLWLAPYNPETKSVIEGEVSDEKWQKLCHNNIYRFKVSGINTPENPEPEIELKDQILIIWHTGHQNGKFHGANKIKIGNTPESFEFDGDALTFSGVYDSEYLDYSAPEYYYYCILDNSSHDLKLDNLYYQMYQNRNAISLVNNISADIIKIENRTKLGNYTGDFTCVFLTDLALANYCNYFPTDHEYRLYTKDESYKELKFKINVSGKEISYPSGEEFISSTYDSRGYKYFTFEMPSELLRTTQTIYAQSPTDFSSKKMMTGYEIFLQHIEGEGDFYVFYLD